MNAIYYRSEFVASSCRFNILEPAVCYTISLLSSVSRVRLPSCVDPTAMSDSKSLNTSSLKVTISSKNEHVLLHDLSDLTLLIMFHTWCASKNIVLKWPIAWKDSRHAPSWRFYLQCGIEEIGSPGIICIVWHQVLHHPSEHGTSSMGKHFLAKTHIAKLHKLTKSEVTELTCLTVDETAFAILKRQGSRGITIVGWQRQLIFDIQGNPYWPK